MAGAVAMVVVLLIFPVTILMSGGFGAAIIGWFLKENADLTHEGSELIDLNG